MSLDKKKIVKILKPNSVGVDFVSSIIGNENSIILELYERVDVINLDKLRYSKKLRDDSTRDKNMIGLIDMYSKRVNNGMVKVLYKLEGYGRLKNVIKGDIGFSYTNMSKPSRNLLSSKFYDYYDINNAQPRIIYNLCKKLNIPAPGICDYVLNRDNYIVEIINRTGKSKKDIKSMLISLFYGKSSLEEIKFELFKSVKISDWVINLFNEIKDIRKKILDMPVYKDLIEYSNKKRKDKKKDYNLSGSAFCLIIQSYERVVILEFIKRISKDGIIIGSEIHDGVLLEKSNISITDVLLKSWINDVSIVLGTNLEDGYLPYVLRREEMDIDESYLETTVFDYYDKPKYEYNTFSSQFLDYDMISNYFNDNKLRVLKSGYGTGKTTFIIKMLDNIDTSVRIIFLSMRQSFARSVYKAFDKYGFNNYLIKGDDKISCFVDRLIISIDSLYKIDGVDRYPYDIVICDEFCSLLNHMSFGGIKNQQRMYNIFDTLIKKSKMVYFLDGDISNREVMLLKNYYNYVDKPLINTCVNLKYEFVITSDYKWYLEQIDADVTCKNNIAIASMSSNFTEYMGVKFKDINPLIINADTDDTIKVQLYDVNEMFSNRSLVAYSPTLGSGVDYNVPNHFIKLYGYMCGGSVCARDFCQMLFRIRHIVDKKVIIYAKNLVSNTLPLIVSFEEIRDAMYKDYPIPPLTFIELWNKWERDNNNMYLLDIFIYYARIKGHTITIRNDDEHVTDDIDNNDQTNSEDDITNEENIIMKNIFESELVSDDIYNGLLDKINNNNAVRSDKYKIDKYVNYTLWKLSDNIEYDEFKRYYNKLGLLRNYNIYSNIDKFRKLLKMFGIDNNDNDIYNNFTTSLIDNEDIDKSYNKQIDDLKLLNKNISKIEKEKLDKNNIIKDNIRKISKLLEVDVYNVKYALNSLFWKMGYNLEYMKSYNNGNKNLFCIGVHNTIYKNSFNREIIKSKLKYVDSIMNELDMKIINAVKSKEEIESKMSVIKDIVNTNDFRVLYNTKGSNIKSMIGMLRILNTVMNCFGLEVKMIQEGNSKHRKYNYKLQRLEIIEEYLIRVENNKIEIDM